MLLLLLQFLCDHFHFEIPAAFTYVSTRMMLAALTTLLGTIFLGPTVIRRLYEMKTGQSIRVEACPLLVELHKKKKETPTMGGILLLFTMLVSLLLWMDLSSPFTLILAVTTVWLGIIGGYDDYLKLKYKNSKGLRARTKFALQLLLAALIGLYLYWPTATRAIQVGDWLAPPVAKEQIYNAAPEGETKGTYTTNTLTIQQYSATYFVPFFKNPIFVLNGGLLILAFIFTLFIITGSSNAVNLTDGLDGLAAGTLVMASIVLALFAFLSNNIEMARYLNILYIEQSGEIAVYLCALVGACLGFLWYNSYPAQVFMGDIGSLALGGILGVSAVLLRRELLLGLVGGIFVAEALSVIIQVLSYRYRGGKRVFLCSPLHHHFEYKGWPETKVVLRFWIIALVLAMLGIISLKFQ